MRQVLLHFDTIIRTYDGKLPLAHYLKNYYKQHPILGSRDRKMLTGFAFGWYRTAKGAAENVVKEQMQLWLTSGDWSTSQFADWFLQAGNSFSHGALFPFATPLSPGITRDEWLRSMTTQPNLFIRIRKDRERIQALLKEAGIPFTAITETCLALPNGAKIETLLPPASYVVQDASSQQTGSWFHPAKKEKWYDCCSGAGGKSLLLKDKEPTVKLTVSDKRASILHNLQDRFRLYGHNLPEAIVTDVSDAGQLGKALGNERFDKIICDAPCSGSGTWARTPEQLYFFNPETLPSFAALQTTIATNVARYLNPGGSLYYITCSVFKQENEDVVNALVEKTNLTLHSAQIINGASIHADSMFIAELLK